MPSISDPDDPVPIINCKKSDVIFNPGEGTYSSTIDLELSRSGETIPECTYEIRYTLNGSNPTESSTLFASGITITETTTVKARVYGKYQGAINSTGDINSQDYIILPIVLCGGGSGTLEDPKIICTPKELHDVRYNLDWHYLQGQDIDLNHERLSQLALDNPNDEDYNWYFIHQEYGELGWQGIGTEDNNFQGVYDGNNYEISNLYASGCCGYSLFGNAQYAEFKNINLTNVNLGYAGLITELDYGKISNCHVTGEIDGAGAGLVGVINSVDINNCSFTGSFIGWNMAGSALSGGLVAQATGDSNISNSYTIIGEINADSYVGGLIGSIVNTSGITTVNKCYSVGGNISGGPFVGGLIGGADSNVIIKNCYSDNNVTNTYGPIGGLVGHLGNIINSYSIGKVTTPLSNEDLAGGLLGGYSNGLAISSYWDINTSGQTTSKGGTPKTTTEMKQQATFVDWNFTDIWAINETTSYPYFQDASGGEEEGDPDAPEKKYDPEVKVIIDTYK